MRTSDSWLQFRRAARDVRAMAETSAPIMLQGCSSLAVAAFAFTIAGMAIGPFEILTANDNEAA